MQPHSNPRVVVQTEDINLRYWSLDPNLDFTSGIHEKVRQIYFFFILLFLTLVQNVQFVSPAFWLPLVNHVGHEIVRSALRIFLLQLRGEQVAKLDRLDGKVNDRRVLLHVEGVLGEALYVQDDVGREPGDLELLEQIVLVRLVLLLGLAVEFRQDVVQADLRWRMKVY